jgi:cytochrome c oxidase subunit III
MSSVSAPAADHFPSREVAHHAARMGMWLFLASELLLFAGLFTGYGAYRYLYPEVWAQASKHLDVVLGTVNTVVLITSSLTVALGVHFAQRGKNRMTLLVLGVSIALGLAFLGIKGVEYGHKIAEGALPGRFYSYEGLQLPGASMFFSVYFLTTGLHGVHVVIGLAVLCWLSWKAWRGEFSRERHLAMELGGLYWHLVDLVWIFLYPLLYLV